MSDDPNDHEEWFQRWLAEAKKMLLGQPYDRTILDPRGVRQDNEDATYDAKNEEQW